MARELFVVIDDTGLAKANLAAIAAAQRDEAEFRRAFRAVLVHIVPPFPGDESDWRSLLDLLDEARQPQVVMWDLRHLWHQVAERYGLPTDPRYLIQ